MDWKNWTTDDSFNYLEDETYFYGTVDSWNDYTGGHTYFNGGDMPVGIDDIGAGTAKSIASQMYKDSTLVDIPNIDGYWGYSGLNYNKMRVIADKTNVPEDRWFGVKSIKDYQDTGYAVFTISGVEGDVENAYLSITTLPDPGQIPAFARDKEISLPITKAGNEHKTWGKWDEHYLSVVTGAKLTDYYDVKTGGEQTVMVPLSEFVINPGFMEFSSKDYNVIDSKINNEEFMASFVPELHLFTGMGIAKRDSGAAKTMKVNITEAKIAAVDAPANFAAVLNEDGSVTATFNTTLDRGVTFKVKRTCGGVAEYFDAQEGVYIDTTRDSSKTYTYSAVAVYAPLSIEAESEDAVTIESETTIYAKLYKGEGEDRVETQYVAAGTMSAAFFTTVEAGTGYIARYNGDGKLLGANLVAVPAGEEKEASLTNVGATDTVKVMFWTNYEPCVDPVIALVTENTSMHFWE